VGQDIITTVLKNAIYKDRVAGSYLFRGSKGSGKTSTARILCRGTNCSSFADMGDLCGICDGCTKALQDALEIDAASNRGVSDVTELIQNLQYRPKFVESKFIIIDEAHQLTSAALNALLKIVEEPPKHIHFIFCTTKIRSVPTTDIEKAFETLASRCQVFNFTRISSENILAKLHYICKSEGCDVSEDVLISIVGRSDGSLRDAENLLDSVLLLYANNPPEYVVRLLYGDVELQSVKFFRDCALHTVKDGLTSAAMLWDAGCTPGEVAENVLRFIVDIISLKAGLTVYRPSGIVTVLKEISENMEQSRLTQIAVAFNSLKNSNKDTALALELAVCDSFPNYFVEDLPISMSNDSFEVLSPNAKVW
jgi:DNA polymerase III subunit gamma/tau